MLDPDDYRQELREYLMNRDNGMLLAATDYVPQEAMPIANAFFQLTSGTFAEEFITIWEIFDDRRAFTRCMSELSAKANAIRGKSYYSTVVTCTATAKEIGAHIREEVGADNDVEFRHFGDYPSPQAASGVEVEDFYREHVLILTDVVASGSLVKKLADVIESRGGKVVAVLAVVVTAGAHVTQTEEEGCASVDLGAPTPLYSLTDYHICYHTDTPPGDVFTIKIDPVTVLPEQRLEYPPDYAPLIEQDSAFAHFRRSDCLQYGLYQLDDTKHTAIIDFGRLLNECGDEIWQVISPIIRGAEAIVTTYKKDDITFSSFLHDRLQQEVETAPPVVLTVKRDTRDTPYFPQNLRNDAGTLNDKNVVLALSTVTTSAEMRNIVALLASFYAKRIRVLCLLNRMGVYSLDFVKRIEHLLNGDLAQGEAATDPASRAIFQYTPVYFLPCFHSQDLDRMYHNLASIISEHRTKTRVPNFRRLAKQNLAYLSPSTGPRRPARLREVLSREDLGDELGGARWNSEPSLFANVPLDRNVERICAFAGHAALTRDYMPLIEELGRATSRYTLYFILQLVIADVEFLRFTGKLEQVKSQLERRVRKLREDRFRAERQLWDEFEDEDSSESVEAARGDKATEPAGGLDVEELIDSLNDTFEVEIHLIFCLAIIAHFDGPRQYPVAYIQDMLFADSHVSSWGDFPLNLRTQFGDERFMYAISLLLFGAYPGFAEAVSGDAADNEATGLGERPLAQAKDVLVSRLLQMEELSDEADRASGGDGLTTGQGVQANLNLLITELGTHDAVELHQVIRYLHKHILRYSSQHNQTIKILTRAKNGLKELPIEAELNRYRLFTIDEHWPADDVVSLLNRALEQATLLQTIAEYTNRLYRQTPSVMEKELRYINNSSRPGMAHDVCLLEETLLRVRRDMKVSYEDVDELKQAISRLKHDFYSSDDAASSDASHLRETLLSFIVPLRATVADCIREVSGPLEDIGLKGIWAEAERAFLSATPDADTLVLCDRFHLRETVSNLLLNVQHSAAAGGVSPRLRIESRPAYASESSGARVDYVELCISSGTSDLADKMLRNRNNTIAGQRMQIEQYGGRLSIESRSDGAFFVLRLICRADYQRAHAEYEERKQLRAAAGLSG